MSETNLRSRGAKQPRTRVKLPPKPRRAATPRSVTQTVSTAQPTVGAPDGSPSERPGRRYRRVVIDDGAPGRDAPKPAELLATQFPARRPNRRRSPRLSPPARSAHHMP